MDFVPDFELARQQVYSVYNNRGVLNFFNTYSSAYIATNETLRKSMRLMPENCQNALVVAASGDHPLFCSLYGAKHVDTFDICYNAKCIMDIKVAALQCFTYLEYTDFLEELYVAQNINLKPITDVTKIDKILHRLPKIESDYIYALNDKPLFSRGPRPAAAGVLPTFKEYNELRKKVTKPYNFELTSIGNLSGRLTKSYDFIHLSNIFDYVIEGDIEELLLSITKFVNPGGRIVMECFEDDCHFYFASMSPKIAKMSDNNFVMKRFRRTYVLERVR